MAWSSDWSWGWYKPVKKEGSEYVAHLKSSQDRKSYTLQVLSAGETVLANNLPVRGVRAAANRILKQSGYLNRKAD